MKRVAILFAPLLAAACGSSDNDPGPGGVTVGEPRALDEAAEMIEARRGAAEALASPVAAPSATATGAAQ